MKVAFYASAQDVIPRVDDLSWSEIVAMLRTHRRSTGCSSVPCSARTCAAKNGPGWSPVDIVDRRRNENVRAVTVAVFDLDHLREEQVDALDLRGHAWVIHSTHSSRPGDVCLRLAMPLSRPVLPNEWAAVRAAAVAGLALPADPATRDISRFYYLPDAPEGTEPLSDSQDGTPLDVDALLESARAGLGSRVTPATSELPPHLESAEHPTDMAALAEAIRRHARPENRALVGRVLRGEPLAPLGQQDTALQSLMSTVAFCVPNDTPDEAVIHLLRPSFVRTDWQDGTDHLVREALKKLHRARERKIARDEVRRAENRAIRERFGLRQPDTAAAEAPVDEGTEDPDAWVQRLITIESRDGVRIKNCEANVELLLRCSPEWRGVLRFNELTKDIECTGAPTGPLTSLDTLESEIAVWVQRSDYGKVGLMPKPAMVRDALRVVASRNRFDPLREYLEGLVWDGIPRADTWLQTYLGAKGNDHYLRAVGSKWLISAVARAMRPGCKVDTVIILEGLQGLGKSSAFRALGGQWFSDASVDIGSKDSAALASRFWIIELAELRAVRRSDAEALKAFLSRNEDTYRPPYGRVNIQFPRRCIFVGTTNAADYLKYDPSGYRRYWPAACASVDLPALRRDAPQLWAESVARFNRGEQWWLTDEDARLAEEQALARSEDTGGPDQVILEWLLRQPADRRTNLTCDDVARDALLLSVGQVTPSTRTQVGQAMRRLGFRRAQRRVAGAQTWIYVAPEAITSAPVG